MKTVKIQSDNRNIQIECPHCDNWEQLGIDDPCKRLNGIPIIEWNPTREGQSDYSINECLECESKFEVEWDYDNPFTE